MKSRLVLFSEARTTARSVVEKVIADNVFGDVKTLPREDMLELRAALRAAYPFPDKIGWKYAVWLQEIAFAIGTKETLYFEPTKKRVYGWQEDDVMPAMRDWARKQGILPPAEIPPSPQRNLL